MDPEHSFVETVGRMLSRPDFLLPLVAAQHQYRAWHYGLTSAALLEDVFADALSFYVRRFEPEHELSRSARGATGVDYSWDGEAISHKSGLGPSDTSILWDATVQQEGGWTSPFPVTYMSVGYSPARGVGTTASGATIALSPVWRSTAIPKTKSLRLIVLRWTAAGTGTILASLDWAPNTELAKTLSFDTLWQTVARSVADGIGANSIEVLCTSAAYTPNAASDPLAAGNEIRVEFTTRAGIYLLRREQLANVQLTKNNRGQLIPKKEVERLLTVAANEGLWAPMPLWYASYAQSRPPDTFIPLRADFDRRFSSSG